MSTEVEFKCLNCGGISTKKRSRGRIYVNPYCPYCLGETEQVYNVNFNLRNLPGAEGKSTKQ